MCLFYLFLFIYFGFICFYTFFFTFIHSSPVCLNIGLGFANSLYCFIPKNNSFKARQYNDMSYKSVGWVWSILNIT